MDQLSFGPDLSKIPTLQGNGAAQGLRPLAWPVRRRRAGIARVRRAEIRVQASAVRSVQRNQRLATGVAGRPRSESTRATTSGVTGLFAARARRLRASATARVRAAEFSIASALFIARS